MAKVNYDLQNGLMINLGMKDDSDFMDLPKIDKY